MRPLRTAFPNVAACRLCPHVHGIFDISGVPRLEIIDIRAREIPRFARQSHDRSRCVDCCWRHWSRGGPSGASTGSREALELRDGDKGASRKVYFDRRGPSMADPQRPAGPGSRRPGGDRSPPDRPDGTENKSASARMPSCRCRSPRHTLPRRRRRCRCINRWVPVITGYQCP